MQRGHRSVTAEFSAVLRAIHMVLDPKPSIFVDRVARPLLKLDRQMLETALQGQLATAAHYGDSQSAVRIAASLRMFTVLRSRFTRDAFFESGLKQIVLLGAGLDLSLAFEADVPVFAVDHPDTSRWTRSLFTDADLPTDKNLHFVEMDFAEGPEVLLPTLAEYGFHPDNPAFFVWLGVQPYLTIERVLADSPRPGDLSSRDTTRYRLSDTGYELEWNRRARRETTAGLTAPRAGTI